MSDRADEEEIAIKLVLKWVTDNPSLFSAPITGKTLDDILSEIVTDSIEVGAESTRSY